MECRNTLSLILLLSIVGLLSATAVIGQNAMIRQPMSTAALTDADNAFQMLQEKLAQSPRDRNAITSALEQLSRALSDICVPQRSSSEASAPPPSDAVTGPERRPDPSERDLRERLTMQTHRPAGPVGTPSRTPEIPTGQQVQNACAEALSAAAEVRDLMSSHSVPTEVNLKRLEIALNNVRAAAQ
jgi:hypothetical protein